jgi:hypothetical protein
MTQLGAKGLTRAGAIELPCLVRDCNEGMPPWRTRASTPSTPRPRHQIVAVRHSFMQRRKPENGEAIHPARVPSMCSGCRESAVKF